MKASSESLPILLAKIGELAGVERTVTSIALCTIKESGGPPLPPPSEEGFNRFPTELSVGTTNRQILGAGTFSASNIYAQGGEVVS